MKVLLELMNLGKIPLATSSILPILNGYRRPYDKINYWVKKGDLIQVKKGLYVLGQKLSNNIPNPYLLANQLHGPSYVSLDSALSFHGMIPERVFQTSSVTTRPSRIFDTPFGRFDYSQVRASYFSLGIISQGNPESGFFMIASREKALWDKIVLTSGTLFRSKLEAREYLEEDLRLDIAELRDLDLRTMGEWVPLSPKKTSLKLLVDTLAES